MKVMPLMGVRSVTMQETRRRVERRLRRVGIEPPVVAIDQLVDYLLLLERWNVRMNLTALERPDDAVDRLLVEPLLAAREISEHSASLIDIGSGGGSPAIPLKIIRPDLALTMVESKTRKSVFLREVVRHLGLTNCHVETVRFEQLLARTAYLETMDILSIRAVRVEVPELRTFQAFLAPGGQMLWFLGASQAYPMIPPPLSLVTMLPLVESLRSRLVVLRKHDFGG